MPMAARFVLGALCALFAARTAHAQEHGAETRELELPTSKSLLLPLPGDPQRVGGFPTTIALSPDGRYAAVLDDGYGMDETNLRQGIAVLDLATRTITHFSDKRLGPRAQQSFFLGLAFNHAGNRLFASMASLSDPSGRVAGNTGNGIAVYAFDRGKLKPERFLPIPPQMVGPGKQAAGVSSNVELGYAVPYPAGLSLFASPQGERLIVADDLSDDALVLDVATGTIVQRFDLSTSRRVPASFPYTAIVRRDARRAWCSLWNSSEVAELDLEHGTVVRFIAVAKPAHKLAAGSHPTAMMLTPDERFLLVALANADAVAVIDAASGDVRGYLSTRLPSPHYRGTYPTSLAASPDAKRLFVALSSANAVEVFDLTALDRGVAPGSLAPLGFVPTEWYPTAVAIAGGSLLVAAGKGQSTRPNLYAKIFPHPYIAAMLRGSLAQIELGALEPQLGQLTAQVMRSNRIDAAVGELFPGRENPIRHVIYIIKENRTYDQVLGDLGVGDGDPTLTLYGETITPNQHALARRFGVLDNFYDSGEVSGDGHVWSTAAITSDYTEKTWQIAYRGREHSYDYEGEVARELPLYEDEPDVNEPGTGYLWANAAHNGISYRHYGEYVATFFCEGRKLPAALHKLAAEMLKRCAHPTIHPGDPVPTRLGHPDGERSPWPWQVPVPLYNVASKPELRGHFDPHFPDFHVDYPDQWRADEFLIEFREFERKRALGEDALPQLIVARLPNDHTGGTRPFMVRPVASIADNDLALGRIVEAVSHSAYWDDTALLVLEDDAQNGADHVDAHRSIAFVISKYAPRQPTPFVDHHFYTTVSMVHTIEALLGLPPMNGNDSRAPLIAPEFSGDGTQPAFDADYRNRDNGLLYEVNPISAPGSEASSAMDFSRADAVDSKLLNKILWNDAHRTPPPPRAPARARHNVTPLAPDKPAGGAPD